MFGPALDLFYYTLTFEQTRDNPAKPLSVLKKKKSKRALNKLLHEYVLLNQHSLATVLIS